MKSIYAISQEISQLTGSKVQNVHSSIRSVIRSLDVAVMSISYKVDNQVFSELMINDLTFIRGKSMQWQGKDQVSRDALERGRAAQRYASKMMYTVGHVDQQQDETEALVFAHGQRQIVIPVTNEPDHLDY